MHMKLETILEKAQVLFHAYCKKSVTECFQVVELPSPGGTAATSPQGKRSQSAFAKFSPFL